MSSTHSFVWTMLIRMSRSFEVTSMTRIGLESFSGTNLLAATACRDVRLDSETFGQEHVEWADERRVAVGARIDLETGVLAPVINTFGWGDRTPAVESPEG
ncbi:hypothetical protein EG328_006631 [Venturia inaequalis]|uniref:Uncharacterized protein n=1 Tax=Venturia inaequalis TaxID=5025 RepID=A0A8H3UJJ1_VENIN|nr:hypothetical protein EG328_006631 [Venturia inaequalis]KAE9994690.1 hypothetical protein EG327_005136 [Venturia inaequalis]